MNKKHLGIDKTATPLEVAEDLQNIICTEYLYNSSKEEIAKVVEFLESNQDDWLRESLTYEIELADYKIAEWDKKKAEAEEKLAQIRESS